MNKDIVLPQIIKAKKILNYTFLIIELIFVLTLINPSHSLPKIIAIITTPFVYFILLKIFTRIQKKLIKQ